MWNTDWCWMKRVLLWLLLFGIFSTLCVYLFVFVNWISCQYSVYRGLLHWRFFPTFPFKLYATLIHCNIFIQILFVKPGLRFHGNSLFLFLNSHSSTFNWIIWFFFEFWMLLNNVVSVSFENVKIFCWETYYYFIRKKCRQCLPFSLSLSLSLTVNRKIQRPGKFRNKIVFHHVYGDGFMFSVF